MEGDEARLRDFIRDANKAVWQAYCLMQEQATFNSLSIDFKKQESKREKVRQSRRTYKIKRFAKELHDLNGRFCKEFKKEIYNCACDKCLKVKN